MNINELELRAHLTSLGKFLFGRGLNLENFLSLLGSEFIHLQ
jgi:hypothetical protein